MSLLLIYLAIAIGVSFVCSILEAVLLSVTPGFLEAQLLERPRRALVMKAVKNDLDHSISAILILNTFAHTMGAAGVGAQAVRVFGPQFESLIAFLLTLAILYFSEIIPKTLGAVFWKQLALPASYVIRVLVRVLYPFVWFSSLLTRAFSRHGNNGISRKELLAMAKLGRQQGALGTHEGELMENILSLRQTRTADILTPRTVVTALEAECTLGQALDAIEDSPFTRIPVYARNIDHIIGIAFRPVLYKAEMEGGDPKSLREYAAPAFRVSEELPVLMLLDQFIKRREHMFIVEDEYGQTAGIVTLEDAVETLLGREIMDESDRVEDMQALARSKFRGRLRSDRRDP